jgi:sugar transferase (PEP-CTERM system associated)
MFRRLLAWVFARERVLIIGTTEAGANLARELSVQCARPGVEIVGFVHLDRLANARPVAQGELAATIDDVPDIVRRLRIDRLVVDLADARGRLPMAMLLDLRLRGIAVDDIAAACERYMGRIAVEHVRPSWLIFSSGFRHSQWRARTNRLFDLVAGVAGLVLAAPLMAMVAAAVKLTSPGPVFYAQQRVGQHGRVFTMRKFRSMHADAEATTGPVWAIADDPRRTPIGAFLRRTCLDELPQLWNVLVADMSLVGPRPERPEFVSRLEREIRFYGQRHLVKPGLTGWAQISFPYGASVEAALQKQQYDLYYLKHMSIVFDVFILLATLKTVWSRTGS